MNGVWDDAVAVRGGLVINAEVLREQAEDSFAEHGKHTLSVWVAVKGEEETDEEVIARLATEAPIPNRQLRATTVGTLRALGFQVVKTGRNPRHYDVDIGSVEPEAIERFMNAFGNPRRNPAWSG